MVTPTSLPFDSEINLRAELDELRHSLLSEFLPALLALAWLFFGYIFVRTGLPGHDALPAIILATGAGSAYLLRGKSYRLACWAALAGMILGLSLLVAQQPGSLAIAFGVLAIIVANALLGAWAALLTATLLWVTHLVARNLVGGAEAGHSMPQAILLYYLTWGASWLASRPQRTAVQWALAGWEYARNALREARERSAELYRVVRALEEATYRIERMNNALIVAQREAEEARALKARLAATVSHELRGPLNLILGFSKLMALSPESYGEPLPRAYRADVYTIYQNSQHLVALVDDILDLSQIEAQKLPLVKDRVDLEEDVVKKTVHIVEPLAKRKGLYLRLELAGNLPWVLADPVRLRQALLNLLNNALRFTERGGITVRTAQQGNFLLVSVRDTGPGIPAEEMPKLFREFHKVDVATGQEKAGSGLGLSISKHLIELHGGTIWAESQEGLGTTFYFTVPLPGSQPSLAGIVKTHEAQHPKGEDSCLIVHDDAGVVRLLARHIEGYHVVGLPDEDQVVTLTEELHPRAIITTPERAERIRERLAQSPFDVSLITCSLPRMAERSQLQGVVSYLVKPITPEALAATMRQVERDGETTVLLVDDDPDAVRLLERMLNAVPHPYHILKAYDGLQALEIMQETVPDVVFMDLVMPGLDGWQAIARMRAEERTRGVPVVIISARDWMGDNADLGTSLTVVRQQPLDMTRGARCLRALLDALSPRYLPEAESSAPSAKSSLDRSASGAPPPRPGPAPARAG
jgi:signal transduction histidine kinase/CheY-like chemotaxis protein